jgi:hypothetical protein
MEIYIIMLIVAIIPTGTYSWDAYIYPVVCPSPQPNDYAIYHLGTARSKNVDVAVKVLMAISVLLLAAGFASRSVRLFENLSVQVVDKARTAISRRLRGWLRHIYEWIRTTNSPSGFKRQFCYRLPLAIFLMLRVLADIWTSMFVEVS